KRDERLRGDCREAEGSRPEPLGQAHGVERGGPTFPLPTRATMPETPVPGGGHRLTKSHTEAASASGPVTLFDIPGGFCPAGASVCLGAPSTGYAGPPPPQAEDHGEIVPQRGPHPRRGGGGPAEGWWRGRCDRQHTCLAAQGTETPCKTVASASYERRRRRLVPVFGCATMMV